MDGQQILFGIDMRYDDLLALTLLVPVACGIALIAMGVHDRRKPWIGYGAFHTFALMPLIVNEFRYGWQPSIQVGKILIAGFCVYWVGSWFLGSAKVVAYGACGVAGLAAHVYVIAGSP